MKNSVIISDSDLQQLIFRVSANETRSGELQDALQYAIKAKDASKEISEEAHCHSLAQIANLYEEMGKFEKALETYHELYKLAEPLFSKDPNNTEMAAMICIACLGIGNVYSKLSKHEAAIPYFQQQLSLAQKMMEDWPDVSSQTLFAMGCQQFAELYIRIKQPEKAIQYAIDFNEVMKLIIEETEDEPSFLSRQSLSYILLGDCYRLNNELDKSLTNYHSANDIVIKLAEQYPYIPEYKHNIILSQEKIGMIYLAREMYEPALDILKKNHENIRNIFEKSRDNLLFISYLPASLQRLGEVCFAMRNYDEAINYYMESLQVCKANYEKNPEYIDMKRGIAICHHYIGNIFKEQGLEEDAEEHYLESYQVMNELYKSYPDNPLYKVSLADACCFLASIYMNMDKTEYAATFFLRAKTFLTELTEDYPETEEYKDKLGILINIIA
jgi:tetratricopeptide (TPR) repeat protein